MNDLVWSLDYSLALPTYFGSSNNHPGAGTGQGSTALGAVDKIKHNSHFRIHPVQYYRGVDNCGDEHT